VISGLEPVWLWRVMLVVVSVALYWVFMELLAVAIRPFCDGDGTASLNRLRRITLVPFFAAIAAAGAAGALNPRGLMNVFAAAIPAAAASFGFTQLDHLPRVRKQTADTLPAEPIERNAGVIAIAVVVAALFIGLLGPGVRLS
jgi:hypothetical protein